MFCEQETHPICHDVEWRSLSHAFGYDVKLGHGVVGLMIVGCCKYNGKTQEEDWTIHNVKF